MAPAGVAARSPDPVEPLKSDGSSSRKQLRIVRNPATGEDHQKVVKIFDLCVPYWDGA